MLGFLVALAFSAAALANDVEARYNKTCVVCHAAGTANAPKTGDAAAWEPRLAKGMDALRRLEEEWGGTAQERLDRRYAAYAAERGATVVPPPRRDEDIFDRVEAEARLDAEQTQEIAEEFVAPRSGGETARTPPSDALTPVSERGIEE